MLSSRKSYTATFKLDVIKYAKEHGNRSAGREFEVNEKNIRRWMKEENELLKTNPIKRTRRGRKPKWPNLGKKLANLILAQKYASEKVKHSDRSLKNMASVKLEEISSNKCFDGFQKVYSHDSEELKCRMNFGVYIPANAKSEKVPVMYWLSGLTCTEQTFITKAGAQRFASKYNVLVVNPDTSPRGCGIEGEDESWDFGSGASFYIDATEEKWKKNYRMYSYVTKELPEIINANFNVSNDNTIFGHSMGGHGALICALKNPGMYKFVSVFAPVSNPIRCPWGEKALSGYLGTDKNNWKDYDATELVKNYKGPKLTILMDTGTNDKFLKEKQLLPENFVEAAKENKQVEVLDRMQKDYDHSYFFISTFIEDHFKHHAGHFN